MEEDLDHILLDQWKAARRTRASLRRLKRLCPADRISIEDLEHRTANRIHFFESMISDKTLLKKRKRVKKDKTKDVLYRHPFVCYYRNAYMMVMFTYQMLTYYLTLWSKKENK